MTKKSASAGKAENPLKAVPAQEQPTEKPVEPVLPAVSNPAEGKWVRLRKEGQWLYVVDEAEIAPDANGVQFTPSKRTGNCAELCLDRLYLSALASANAEFAAKRKK